MFITILIISIIIVLVVLLLAVVTTSKAYTYKHTIDQVAPEEPTSVKETDSNKKDSQD
jgi:flagellar basal body-associated protein FliL